MKSAKVSFNRVKKNNFFGEGEKVPLPPANLNLGNPKSDAYEKRYFHQMISRLQKSAPMFAPRRAPVVASSAAEVLEKTFPFSQQVARKTFRKSVFEKRRKRSVSPFLGERSASSGSVLEVVGVRSIMAKGSSSRSITPLEEGSVRMSRSREILHKLHRKVQK
jgi:hypothetical protein